MVVLRLRGYYGDCATQPAPPGVVSLHAARHGTPHDTAQGRGLGSRGRVVRSDGRRTLRVGPTAALVLRGMRNAVAAARRGAKCQIPV